MVPRPLAIFTKIHSQTDKKQIAQNKIEVQNLITRDKKLTEQTASPRTSEIYYIPYDFSQEVLKITKLLLFLEGFPDLRKILTLLNDLSLIHI